MVVQDDWVGLVCEVCKGEHVVVREPGPPMEYDNWDVLTVFEATENLEVSLVGFASMGNGRKPSSVTVNEATIAASRWCMR